MKIFVDTWGWLVAVNRAEKDHERISKIFKEQKGQFYTSGHVLSETITILFLRHHFDKGKEFIEKILETAAVGNLNIKHITEDLFQKAWDLRLKYKDKPKISFVDLTSFVIMRELGIKKVITGDKHFTEVGLGFAQV